MKRWTWTKQRRAIRDSLRPGGMTPTEMKAYLSDLRRQAAKEHGWRDSELVATILDDNNEVDEIARRMGLT